MTDRIDKQVLKFIELNIDTVPHLEALLLLWQSSPKKWEIGEVASRIYISVPQARSVLDDLTRRDLMASDAESGRYGFNPQSEASLLLPAVAETYRRELIRISTFIHSKGSMSVREFARAFQIKGDPKK